MYEQSESYDILVKKLDSMGLIKVIINNPIFIDTILSYNGDRQVLVNSFTSKEMSSILFDDKNDERTVMIRNKVNSIYDDLPRKVQLSMISEALLKGRSGIANDLLERVSDDKVHHL